MTLQYSIFNNGYFRFVNAPDGDLKYINAIVACFDQEMSRSSLYPIFRCNMLVIANLQWKPEPKRMKYHFFSTSTEIRRFELLIYSVKFVWK